MDSLHGWGSPWPAILARHWEEPTVSCILGDSGPGSPLKDAGVSGRTGNIALWGRPEAAQPGEDPCRGFFFFFFLDHWKAIMGRESWYLAVTGEDGGDQRKFFAPVQILMLTAVQSLRGRALPSVCFSLHARSSQLWLNTSITQHLSKNTTSWIPPRKTLQSQ